MVVWLDLLGFSFGLFNNNNNNNNNNNTFDLMVPFMVLKVAYDDNETCNS